MALNINKYGTYTLTDGVIEINANNGICKISMKLISGGGSYIGELKIGQAESSAIAFVVNDPVSFGGNQPINYLRIDTSAGGVVQLIFSDGQ